MAGEQNKGATVGAIDWTGLLDKVKNGLEKLELAAPEIENFLVNLASILSGTTVPKQASGPKTCDHHGCCGATLDHLLRATAIVLKHQADCAGGCPCDHAACCCAAQKEILAAATACNDHCSCCD